MYQRFNVCCFHACTGQTVPSLFPFSISPYHAHHTPLAQALSCPPPHTLSMSSCPYLYPSYQKPLASGTLSPSLHHPSSPRDQTISISVSYTHLRAHETDSYLVCRLLLEKKNKPHSST